MTTLLIALLSGVGFLVAYHTYGRWLGSKIFRLSADAICPSERLKDGVDYVPTSKSVVFGHHFTSIAGTGPIVGPAIAIMWGWVPALFWVVLGSIFIGAVHDFGALVVSLRNNGQTVGDIAGRVLNRRVRLLFAHSLHGANGRAGHLRLSHRGSVQAVPGGHLPVCVANSHRHRHRYAALPQRCRVVRTLAHRAGRNVSHCHLWQHRFPAQL